VAPWVFGAATASFAYLPGLISAQLHELAEDKRFALLDDPVSRAIGSGVPGGDAARSATIENRCD
jgi:hypothetical protein